MAATAAIASATDVRAFFIEYFGAWQGTDVAKILSYYTEDVMLSFAGTMMNGRDAVEMQFVRPIVGGFPGNRHIARNMIFGSGVVAIEWDFEAEHLGPFAGLPATGTPVRLPGCSVYEFDPVRRQITGGRIYADINELMRQIGAT